MKIPRPGKQTAWDTVPILGINAVLGFVYLRVDGDRLIPFTPTPSLIPSRESPYWDFEAIVVHKSRVRELQAWAWRCRTGA